MDATARRPSTSSSSSGVARIVVEPGVLDDGLPRSRPQVDAAGLEHQAHAGSQRPTAARRILPEDPHRPVVGAPVALDDLDRRRLARAVGAEQRDQLAGRHAERDAVHHRPVVVALAQILDDDRRGGHGAIRA